MTPSKGQETAVGKPVLTLLRGLGEQAVDMVVGLSGVDVYGQGELSQLDRVISPE